MTIVIIMVGGGSRTARDCSGITTPRKEGKKGGEGGGDCIFQALSGLKKKRERMSTLECNGPSIFVCDMRFQMMKYNNKNLHDGTHRIKDREMNYVRRADWTGLQTSYSNLKNLISNNCQ